MNKSVVFIAILFSVFSTVIMSYISMATPIGPWVELILVLMAIMIFRVFLRYQSSNQLKKAIGLTTVAGGVGGIIATVCGFTLPTLYFLQPEHFNALMAQPYYAWSIIAGLVLVSGSCAFIIIQFAEKSFLANETLTFPIGLMVSKMIVAQNQLRKAIELCTGIVLTTIFGLLQAFTSFIPSTITLFPRLIISAASGKPFLPAIVMRLDLLPIFIAVGYVAGDLLMLPLAMGMVTKIFFLEPLTATFFSGGSESAAYNFIVAFGGGMILQAALATFVRFPKMFIAFIKRVKVWFANGLRHNANFFQWKKMHIGLCLWCVTTLITGYLYARHFGFSGTAQLYVLLFSIVCVYQIVSIGGKVGLAPLGRFVTLVMLPGFLLFDFTPLQITLVSAFVGLTGGIAIDLMFGRKMGQQVAIDTSLIKKFQWLGLVIAALLVGVVFFLLVKRFGLGLEELAAQRAQARALLISAYSFNGYGMVVGFLYGCFLAMVRFNSLLVFTGLLFPVQYSLMLIGGGLITLFAQDKEDWDPFWSGVFAAGSLLIFVQALI